MKILKPFCIINVNEQTQQVDPKKKKLAYKVKENIIIQEGIEIEIHIL